MSGLLARLKYIVVLLLLMILDIAPVPIIGMIGLAVLLFRPRWFKEMVDRIYADKGDL